MEQVFKNFALLFMISLFLSGCHDSSSREKNTRRSSITVFGRSFLFFVPEPLLLDTFDIVLLSDKQLLPFRKIPCQYKGLKCADINDYTILESRELKENISTEFDFWNGRIRSEEIESYSEKEDETFIAVSYDYKYDERGNLVEHKLGAASRSVHAFWPIIKYNYNEQNYLDYIYKQHFFGNAESQVIIYNEDYSSIIKMVHYFARCGESAWEYGCLLAVNEWFFDENGECYRYENYEITTPEKTDFNMFDLENRFFEYKIESTEEFGIWDRSESDQTFIEWYEENYRDLKIM